MTCKDCHISIKIKKPTFGYKAGQVVKVQASDGVPIQKYWRDLLKDAKIDGNCEIIKPRKKSEAKR